MPLAMDDTTMALIGSRATGLKLSPEDLGETFLLAVGVSTYQQLFGDAEDDNPAGAHSRRAG